MGGDEDGRVRGDGTDVPSAHASHTAGKGAQTAGGGGVKNTRPIALPYPCWGYAADLDFRSRIFVYNLISNGGIRTSQALAGTITFSRVQQSLIARLTWYKLLLRPCSDPPIVKKMNEQEGLLASSCQCLGVKGSICPLHRIYSN